MNQQQASLLFMRETGLTSQQGRVTIPEAGRWQVRKGEKKEKRWILRAKSILKNCPTTKTTNQKNQKSPLEPENLIREGHDRLDVCSSAAEGPCCVDNTPQHKGTIFWSNSSASLFINCIPLVQQQKNHQDQLHLSSTDKLPN